MSITITSERMGSDRTGHHAALIEPQRWRVSWLPGRLVSRDEATTALVLAEELATGPAPGRRRCGGWRSPAGRPSWG
jgi:hypothetical protein